MILLNKKRGFIALVSVIIISFVLLITAVTLSLTGFFVRFNIFDSENKERSNALADACIESARLALAADTSYSGNDKVITINVSEKCEYDANLGGSEEIIAHACTNGAHTYYRAIVDVDLPDIPIVIFEELPTSNVFAFSCNL